MNRRRVFRLKASEYKMKGLHVEKPSLLIEEKGASLPLIRSKWTLALFPTWTNVSQGYLMVFYRPGLDNLSCVIHGHKLQVAYRKGQEFYDDYTRNTLLNPTLQSAPPPSLPATPSSIPFLPYSTLSYNRTSSPPLHYPFPLWHSSCFPNVCECSNCCTGPIIMTFLLAVMHITI